MPVILYFTHMYNIITVLDIVQTFLILFFVLLIEILS